MNGQSFPLAIPLVCHRESRYSRDKLREAISSFRLPRQSFRPPRNDTLLYSIGFFCGEDMILVRWS